MLWESSGFAEDDNDETMGNDGIRNEDSKQPDLYGLFGEILVSFG